MLLSLASLSADLREKLLLTPTGKKGKYSLTRQCLEMIFPALLRIAKEERGFEGEDITSHDCAALFQGKSWKDGSWTDTKDKNLQFHPVERFPELFSDKMPDRMKSYTWAKYGLIKDLPHFLDQCEILAPPNANGETTYWVDILINDQNSPDIKLFLDLADNFYSASAMHIADLFGGMLDRAWCNSEIATRFLSGLKSKGLWKEGQENTAAVIRGGELLREGDPAFTIFVAVEGLTDVEKDIACKDTVDRFGGLKAFDQGDLKEIKRVILEVYGSAEAFNFTMVVVRNAVLERYADTHQARRAVQFPSDRKPLSTRLSRTAFSIYAPPSCGPRVWPRRAPQPWTNPRFSQRRAREENFVCKRAAREEARPWRG
jgi:hypothetical protein